MQELNNKTTGNKLPASEWNEVPGELQNVIEALGITLSPADLNQLGKAIAGYVANGDFYTDSGVADAYVLAVIGTKQAPPEYTNGFRVRFVATNNNTGASTVNVASLGVKAIKRESGAALQTDEIVAGKIYEVYYDGTDFILTPVAASGVNSDITALSGIISTAEVANLNAAAVGGLRVKVIEIGDWDMDVFADVFFSHGLTLAKIRSISVSIRDDVGNLYDFSALSSAEASSQSTTVFSTNVSLRRAVAGLFDDPSFNSTPYNRGWVTIWYVN